MICPQCKTPNRDSAKFCDECGWRLAEATDTSIPAVVAEEVPEDPRVANLANLPQTMDEDVLHNRTDAQSFGETLVEHEAVGAVGVGPEPTEEPFAKPEEPVRHAADLSGFVFVDSAADASSSYSDPAVFNTFETASIPLNSMWGSGHTEAMPKIEGMPSAAPVSVSAPANKKDERARRRAMKKQEKEARKQLKDAQRSKDAVNRKVVVIAVIVIIAAICAAAGLTYYYGIWGGHPVPDVQGKSEADATYTLEREGFSVRVSHVKSDDTEGLVLLTDPAAGSRVANGSEVVIHVSESRVIPSVVGTDIEQAKKLLDEESFSSPVEYTYTRTNSVKEGTVLSVSPEVGTKAKSNTKVTVEVATPCRVPDVSGMTSDNATYTLREAGYYVYVSEAESSTVPEGTVYATSPEKNEILDLDEYVTIYVAVSRATMRTNMATQYLSSVGSVTINGTLCTVDSVVSVVYNESAGTAAFTIMGSPTVVVMGVTVTLPSQSISGTVFFDENNQVTGIG